MNKIQSSKEVKALVERGVKSGLLRMPPAAPTPRPINVTKIPVAQPIEIKVNGHEWTLTQEEALELRRQIGVVLSTRHKSVMEAIKYICARKFNVSIAAIDGPGRPINVVRPRHAFMWLSEQAGFSHSEIGDYCGYRNHTGVTSAVNTLEDRFVWDERLRADMRWLIETAQSENGIEFRLSDEVKALLAKI